MAHGVGKDRSKDEIGSSVILGVIDQTNREASGRKMGQAWVIKGGDPEDQGKYVTR